MTLLSLVLIPVFALAYRARGGAIPLGSTTLARLLFFVLPNVCAAAALVTTNWHVLCAVAAGAQIGITFGHSKWQDDDMRSFWGMAWITFVRMVLIFMPVAMVDYRYFSIPFACIPAIWFTSWYGYRTNARGYYLKFWGITWCDPTKGSEWEELYIGASYGFAWAIPPIMKALGLGI